RPELPAELEAVVRKCLSKLRDDRYGSVVELSRALEPFTRAEDSGARRQMGSLTVEFPALDATWIALGSSLPPPPDDTPPAPSAPRPRPRRAWLVAAAGAGVALTLAASALTALVASHPARASASQTHAHAHGR